MTRINVLPAMQLYRIMLFTSFISLMVSSMTALAQQTPPDGSGDASARSIVEKADRVRFPAEAFQVEVDISTTQKGQRSDARKYRVLSKGNENTVVMVIEPAAERGQSMLLKSRDLWVFMPNVSQPVRISLAQRLTGQIANGDLARANFAGDYNAKVLRNETIEGENFHVLELTAVDRSVTYARVVYWVKVANAFPHKAEFYSVSNRLLKTARYERFQTIAGAIRPTRIVMEDALRQDEQSVLDYSDMKLRDLPDRMFTKDYMKRLD